LPYKRNPYTGKQDYYEPGITPLSVVIAATIVDGDVTHAPDGNSVYDALALKAPLANPTFTGTVTTPTLKVDHLSEKTTGHHIVVDHPAVLPVGTAAAGTAPLKFTVAGTALVTAPEVGVLEPFSDDLYYTISTGVARKGVVLTDGYPLTSGRVSYSTTNGRQTDDACLTCVPPALVIKGTTATNTASYGAEVLTSAGWTVTAGWTESPDDVFTHAAGVTTLSHSATVDNDQRYQVTWTVTGYSAGHFDITFGGIALNGLSSSDAYGPTTIGTDAFTVTPSNDFVGTVVLSLKKINAKSTAVVLLKSSEGTTRLEMRAPSGGNSTFVGEGTGGFLTTGNGNHGFGKESLNNITSGTASNGFGSYAVYGNTTGMHNNAYGFAALYHNVTGSFNVAVGGYALEENVDGSSNVAIGFEAGHWETGSNKLFIDNSARTNEADGRIKALIYGVFAAATADQYLTVNGHLTVLEDITTPTVKATNLTDGYIPYHVNDATGLADGPLKSDVDAAIAYCASPPAGFDFLLGQVFS
jgi:hypothetical protein